MLYVIECVSGRQDTCSVRDISVKVTTQFLGLNNEQIIDEYLMCQSFVFDQVDILLKKMSERTGNLRYAQQGF